jgi:predicted SAM-dependent methyltransferase
MLRDLPKLQVSRYYEGQDMPRKYDENGRVLLRALCVGRGLDVGCHEQKVSDNCIGIDSDHNVNPDIVASVDKLGHLGGDWDFIVGSHILEHMPNTIEVLRHWLSLLIPGGTLGVTVPHGEYAPHTTLGDASLTHCQLFTPKTLRLFFQHVGFVDVVSQQYERPDAYKQAPGIFAKGYRP